MHRAALRILGLSVCAAALAGCSMLGGSSAPAASSGPAANQAAAADTSPMAPDVDTSLRQAQLMRSNGDLLGATRIMSQLMLVYPDDPRIVSEYGKLLIQKGATADAVEFLRRAAQLQPSDWTIYSAMGVAFDQQHDPNSARLAYERALSLQPGNGAVLNNYAMSRMMAGDTVTARTLLMQARASGSTDPRIAANIAMLDTMGAPAAGPAAVPAPMLAATPRKPVTTAALPTPAPAAARAPAPLTRTSGNVVMQDVPVDPLAGPVAARTGKPAKLAKAGHGGGARVAVAATAPKPAKKAAKPAPDHIPALRMTADASKP